MNSQRLTKAQSVNFIDIRADSGIIFPEGTTKLAYDREKSWFETGKDAASEMKMDLAAKLKLKKYVPQQIPFIEARGFLFKDLLKWLHGRMEFVRTPKSQYLYRFLGWHFSILPIFRWYPPEESILEWIGYNKEEQTKAYRIRSLKHPTIVFLVKYKPESRGLYGRSPQLDDIILPPFKKSKDIQWNALEKGMWVEFNESTEEV